MALPFISFSDDYNRGERDFKKFYLENADLHGLSIPEIDLTEADLTGANLQGANLSKACLHKAILVGANLKGAIFFKADLSDANLSQADLEGADLTEADLGRAILRQANLNRANLTKARLSQADASSLPERSQEKGGGLRRTSFVEAVLREVNLSDADLRGANLQAANLTQAKMLRADLGSSVAAPLKDAKGKTKILNLAGADLTLASLYKAQVMGDFRKADLSQVDLREATVLGDFREANLTDALTLNTVFNGSNFTGGTLKGVYLEGCKLNKCVMPNGKQAGWDLERFAGAPPNHSSRGSNRKTPTYTEYWFETYDELRALTLPMMCVCCCRPVERFERITREVTISGVQGTFEMKLPYCTACLQHHIRSQRVEHWMKNMCAAPGGNYPAAKFEVKAKSIFGGSIYFVLAFASMEYTIGFAAGNQLPVKGSKSAF